MRTDVAGRVKNTSLPASKPLLPLYEAVVNSIQAIQDAQRIDGKVEIEIIRDEQHLLKEQDPSFGDIVGFEVTDNGIGFDDENFAAFETSDTTYKADRGGRGIGRFLWLVAFDHVEIESHFLRDGTLFHRSFEFTRQDDGIRNLTVAESTATEPATTVALAGFRTNYQRQCPKRLDTMAVHLVEHCLEYFIRPDCPQILLKDRAAGESLDLNELFGEQIARQSTRDDVLVEDQHFYVLHVRLYSTHVRDHQVHFCADSRVVRSEKLLGHVPNLARRLSDEDGREFVYAAYVDSQLLDESVKAERTDFAIVEEEGALLVPAITWQAIQDAVFASSRAFLSRYTDPIRDQKRERIERFVADAAPMYRPILKHIEDKLDLIDPEIPEDKLDVELYQAYHELQVELREEGRELLGKQVPDQEWEEFARQLDEYFDKISDINKSDLARYVSHRRAVLDFLRQQLTPTPDGTYRREDRIHRIIFPPRKTSNEVAFEEHNLWLLDEKLVYHAFLASDKPLNETPGLSTDNRDRPDLVVFDKVCAFTPGSELPFSAITIVEFKRPMRSATPDDNPFVQVRKYVTAIRDGKARTSDGRDIPVGKDIPFFCYVVADITQTLEQQAYDFELTKTPDGQGFFGYKRQYNAYVELISYTKMVDDARRRNAAFFDKLGLPSGRGDSR